MVVRVGWVVGVVVLVLVIVVVVMVVTMAGSPEGVQLVGEGQGSAKGQVGSG